jgi:transposase
MAATKRGRKPKLSPELQAKICDAIRAGNYLEAAATHAGIHPATFHRWVSVGERATSGIYREFYEAVKKAESDSEVVLVAHWRKAASKNWVAAAALLERRFRSRWSRSDHVKVEANVTANLDDQLLEKLGRLVAGREAADTAPAPSSPAADAGGREAESVATDIERADPAEPG